MERKSFITVEDTEEVATLGRSYYIFCLETAHAAIRQGRMLVSGDIVEENHELERIQDLIEEALDAS